jgi:iron complex transport system substrate-binding protein
VHYTSDIVSVGIKYFVTMLSLVLILSGCQPNQNDQTKFPFTVVSLSPSATEIVATYGKPEMLVGRTQACNYPSKVKDVSVVAFIKPNYEKILSIQPDLIVFDPTLFSSNEVERLKGCTKKMLPLYAKNIEQFEQSLKNLESCSRAKISTKSYVERINRFIDQNLKSSINLNCKVAILLDVENRKEYWIAGKKTFQADLLKKIKVNVMGPEHNHFEKVNLEHLLFENPDVIFTKADMQTMLEDKRLASLQAIRKKRVYGIDADILLRAGARVDLLAKFFFERLMKG